MAEIQNPSQNQTLSLVDASDLSTLTIEQAQSLMGRKGWLRLDSLMSLSSDVAAVLARHEGGLGFGMLNSVSEETEEALAGHKGELDIRFLKELKSRALATKLAGQRSWSEGQLLHISDAAAEGLVARPGLLRLNVTALHNLSPHARMLLETHNLYGIAQAFPGFIYTFIYAIVFSILIGAFIGVIWSFTELIAFGTVSLHYFVLLLRGKFVPICRFFLHLGLLFGIMFIAYPVVGLSYWRRQYLSLGTLSTLNYTAASPSVLESLFLIFLTCGLIRSLFRYFISGDTIFENFFSPI